MRGGPSQHRLDGPVPFDDSTAGTASLSVLQWNPCPARKNHTQIIPAACVLFHAVVFQEAGNHVPHISENVHCADGNDLAILLNKDPLVSGAAVFSISEASTSKDTWGLVALVVRGHSCQET